MSQRLIVSVILIGLLLPASISAAADNANQELLYSSKEFAKLDTFEAMNLESADKLFIKKDYRGAYAAYKAYSFDFAKSKALPYVLLRMGRCLHLLDKRNTAIKAYQDVVDYFPNDVAYAAAAMYYIGECHAQNGSEEKSLSVWARMVKDKDYVSQPRSGTALAKLASVMEERGDFEEATTYNWRTAVAFRKTNEAAAKAAREKVIYHYVVRVPNQERLLEFCNEAGGFGWHGNIAKPEESTAYWSIVCDTATGAKLEDEQKKKDVCSYWVGQIGDKFQDNDRFRAQFFALQRAADGDTAKWVERMEGQFKLKPATADRVLEWCSYLSKESKIRSAFFAKYGTPMVAGLKDDEKIKLMNRLRYPLSMHNEAAEVLKAVRLDNMSDDQIRDVAMFAANYEAEDMVMRYVGKIKDKTLAGKTRFDYYYARAHRNGPFQEKALAEIPALRKDPKYAQEVAWAYAVLLQWQGRYDEAIKAFRATNREPQASWAIIDCFLSLKQYDAAVKLARELENIGGNIAPQASLKVADIYRIAGDKGKEVQQLREVLRRHPKSSESSTAHGRLESYGVKIFGGESTADK